MTRTVLVRAEAPKVWRGKGSCEFCRVIVAGSGVRHDLCPGEIGSWTCACHQGGHQGS